MSKYKQAGPYKEADNRTPGGGKVRTTKVAASKPKEAPPAPLPPWLRGDRTGLPMKPPGKGVEK